MPHGGVTSKEAPKLDRGAADIEADAIPACIRRLAQGSDKDAVGIGETVHENPFFEDAGGNPLHIGRNQPALGHTARA